MKLVRFDLHLGKIIPFVVQKSMLIPLPIKVLMNLKTMYQTRITDLLKPFSREWSRLHISERRCERWRWLRSLLALLVFWSISLSTADAQKSAEVEEETLPERVEKFTVRTRSALNEKVPFYLRVPKNYKPGKTYRLLFLCPSLNEQALNKLKSSEIYLNLADERDWFVLSCTFKVEKILDRKVSYYYPESFSGGALLEGLRIVSKKYPVDTERLLLQGISGGAQFLHRFAIWSPERVTAVAINSSSWFDPPKARCNRVAWLVTIGESDDGYNATLSFVDQLRNVGAAPLFRSYLGMVHEETDQVHLLNMEFLKFYDEHTKADLGKLRSHTTPNDELLALRGEKMPFVGDGQDWKYFPNSADALESIVEDSRVYLPSKSIAQLWGQKEEEP